DLHFAVLLDYSIAQSLLFLAKGREECGGFQEIQDSIGGDTTSEQARALVQELPGCRREDRPTIAADDPMPSRRLRAGADPRGHGWGRSGIVHCPRAGA